MRVRYEASDQGLSLTAAIRREPEGSWWNFSTQSFQSSFVAGTTTTSLSGSPIDAGDPESPVLYTTGAASLPVVPGTYAVVVRQGGQPIATRYAVVLDDTEDGDGSVATGPRHGESLYREILLAVRERLVESGVWSDTQVSISLADDTEPHPAEGYTFGRVCPLASMGGPWQDGAGRFATGSNAPVLVRAYVRRITDRAGVATRALALPDGLMELTDRVTDALVQFTPQSAAADILCEPLQLAAHDRPVRYAADEAWYRAEVQLSTTHAVRFRGCQAP